MANCPPGVTYAQAMAALHDAHQTLRDLLREPVDQKTRQRQLVLLLLLDRLEFLVGRDDGRRR